jgi:acyl-CoA thioesterase I
VQKKLLLVVGAVIVIGAFYVIFGGSTKIKNYPTTVGPIVAFGDSLVFGYGSTAGNDFVTLLSKKLGEPITNLGVSGDTAAQGLARIEQVTELKPRVTLVLLGGNDFLRKVNKAETFANLRQIITTIQTSGSAVLLLGVRGGLLIDSVDGQYKSLAKETGSAYVSNVLDGLFGDSRYMFDAIHPNDLGYAMIADRIYPVLLKLSR